MPASGSYTAKADGSYRQLSRLTAIDTIIQTVLADKLADCCAESFSKHSFAYQKGKNVRTALNGFCEYASKYPYVTQIDIRDCFDNIDHSILENALNLFFFNHETGGLLMDYAKIPIIIDGHITDRKKGVLQGMPISGMLCNIYLHSLDQTLEDQGIPFLRYADSIVVFAETMPQVQKANSFVRTFLEDSLHLKSHVSRKNVTPSYQLKYLGHTFIRDKNSTVIVKSGEKGAPAYYSWARKRPLNNRSTVDILSDGILTQKDFSAIFETETDWTSVTLDTIDRINVFSNVSLDSGFLEKAAEKGISINLFSKEYSYLGRFLPSGNLKDQRLVFEQLQAYNDENHRLLLAKQFDLASVHNLRLNIRYYNKQQEEVIYRRALSSNIGACHH